VVEDRPILSKLIHPAAWSLCNSWATCIVFCSRERIRLLTCYSDTVKIRHVCHCLVMTTHYHCLPVNFSNNSIGSMSNGEYSFNLPPWPSKPSTLVVPYISLTSCNTTNLRDLCAHPILISFRSPVTTYLLDLVVFDFPLIESGSHHLSASAYLNHFLLSDVI